MRGHGGAGRFRRSGGGEGLARWRWVSLSLVVLLHAGIYLLLRSAGEAAPPPPREDERRIRLIWSSREPMAAAPVPGQVAKVPAPRAATAVAARRPSLRAITDDAPVPSSPPIPYAGQADAWSFDPAPAATDEEDMAGVRFRRDVLQHARSDPFARSSHLPGLRMRDNSLGGRFAAMARAMECGELKAALGRGSGALAGGGHDPGAARPMGGEASSEAILASMRRRGCR